MCRRRHIYFLSQSKIRNFARDTSGTMCLRIGGSVKNYIDLIPIINSENTWEFDWTNKVIIKVRNKGIVNAFAIKYLNKEPEKEIELDRYGSFVWQQIDGVNTIQDIIDNIVETFEEERVLVTKRTVMFFEMLRTNNLIEFNK